MKAFMRFFRDNGGKIILALIVILFCYLIGKMIYETFWGQGGFSINENSLVNTVVNEAN